MDDRLKKAGWKYFDDPEGRTHQFSDGFYQKRVFSAMKADMDQEHIYANIVRYPMMIEHAVPVSYELNVYLPDNFNFTGEAVMIKVYSFTEHTLSIQKMEDDAKGIVRRLRKP